MNNSRRQQLKRWIQEMEIIKHKLEAICEEEEMAFDSMPEGLQGTLNGMNSEEAIEKMNDAISCVEDAVNYIEEIII